MKLGTQKTLEDLKPVLKDPESIGPDPVYFVFGDVSENKWANITMIQNGKIGEEYPKTFGHYHSVEVNETYHLLSGEGIFQMVNKNLKEIYLIKAKPGDEIVITPDYGHSWSNIGDEPLISFDDWRSGHEPSDYEDIKRLHGMPYYLVEESGELASPAKRGEPKAIANPNYQDLPEPIWITAEEFANKTLDKPE